MILTKQNYETHDQKLLVIITTFKQWKHYLKNNAFSIKMWFDHNNLRNFIKQKKLNQRQIRWALILIVYDFEIFHKSRKTNFVNESSRRLNYEKTSTLNIKFLSSLQNKLTLSKNIRDFLKIFNDAFEITNVRKLNFALNAKKLKKMFENATMKLNVQKFKSLKNIKNLRKMLENASSKSNVHINIFIW